MKTGIRVLDAMTNKPVTVEENLSLQDCAKKMEKEGVGSLLITKSGEIKGIITEQDLVHKVVAKNFNVKKPVSQCMETKLITIQPDADIFEALELMKKNDIRHVPVADNKKIIGLITMKDILKIEPQLFDLIVESYDIREESRKPVFEVTADEGICELCGKYSKSIKDVKGSKVCPECLATL
jgi:signal-transduction protein with cAMP-binding, CBS, and nucleotidyltransferase domain